MKVVVEEEEEEQFVGGIKCGLEKKRLCEKSYGGFSCNGKRKKM